eukprot:TRINITY_DN17587_c0_g1_i1.p1 TRINITY_DN17587_c0_g1~~TRINITY_DN17587_c0_g1_i1.p1  ORF type:complete len:798 (+),score=151.85 TRINITY_DN17587_c0_g1_i1:343-2394(+)
MCEYIIDKGVGYDANLFRWKNPPDIKKYREIHEHFSAGDFYDCGSVVLVGYLLKQWLRELPKPLVPYTDFNRAIDMVVDYLNDCVLELSTLSEFKQQSGNLQGENAWSPLWQNSPNSDNFTVAKIIEEFAFDNWCLAIKPIYTASSIPINQSSSSNTPFSSAPISTQFSITESYTSQNSDAPISPRYHTAEHFISPRSSKPNYSNSLTTLLVDLESWLTNLPTINRDCLEYLCIFLCKYSESMKTSLEELATTFSPCILRSAFQTDEVEDRLRCKYLQSKLIYLLCVKFKRKNLDVNPPEPRKMKYFTDRFSVLSKIQQKVKLSSSDDIGLKTWDTVFKPKEPRHVEKIELKDFDNTAKTLPTQNRNEPQQAVSTLSLPANIPGEVPYAKHFAPEWKLEAGQCVSENGIFMYKQSNFLKFSPFCHNWLREPTRKLDPQFCNQRMEEPIHSSLFYEVDPEICQENEQGKLPPGKGLILQDASKPRTQSDVTRTQFISPALLFLAKLDQGSVCSVCNTSFNIISRRKRNCHCCGSSLCENCCSKKFIIPSRLLKFGDFQSHSICDTCSDLLSRNFHTTFIPLKSFENPPETIHKIKFIHDVLFHIIYDIILPDCPTKIFLLGLITPQHRSFLSEDPMLSMMDLLAIKAHQFLPFYENLLQLYSKHIKDCEYCGPKEQQTSTTPQI